MFEYENKYKDFGLVAGIDEAGRGPLAGPVVCACVIMPLESDKIIEGINDSKKLSAKKRAELYEKIISTAIDYCIVPIDEKTIDEINILNATKLGMEKALNGLKNPPYVVLIDAVKINTSTMQENIIKGDAKSYNIAAASILAKEFRDRLMISLAEKYPNYSFEKHKGYGTKDHITALKQFGKCEIHRDSFIKNFIN
ncbi:MAG: ribonuclease HII [Clostridia bacterium]|nr:ribonuclease HII [Clostridia bacterium]